MRHQNIVFRSLLKQIPWAIFDRLVDRHGADTDERSIKSKAHLIAMLLGQLCGACGLREIDAMQRRAIGELLKPVTAPPPDQPRFDFGLAATRLAQRRRALRATTILASPA